MKLLTLAATALVAATALITPAEARPNSTYCNTLDDGTEFCVAPVGRHSVSVTVDNKWDDTGFIAHGNCATGEVQWRANTGWMNKNIVDTVHYICNN